ncbi:MAG: glycine cleavage system aminomethyltransferase GcvT, partial [Gammaproteobacteria bacterium]|nr:glycine cleavage system aminomethyltransferase GcvT [Gammaproteobacteria bacterium]
MLKTTPLNAAHKALGARMVDFGGWDMPVNYGSQIEEHHAVRRAAGVFDVSHMGVLDLRGARTREFLRQLLANDVARLTQPGKALYSCMLREDAGIIDDLIVYFLDDAWFRMVVNAGRRARDQAWIREHAGAFGVAVEERRELAMLAVQGPQARASLASLLSPAAAAAALGLGAFVGAQLGTWFVARTGYTGEDGFEVMLPAAEAGALWQRLNACGVRSCGLGARDTLRLEAGMNLYGSDMDERTHPLESGLAWTVAFEPADRRFIGRKALEAARSAGGGNNAVGLLLADRAVMRSHMRVATAAGDGMVTSGTFSPTLARSIALARVPAAAAVAGARVQVEVRGRLLDAQLVRPPFVRSGRVLVDL